MKQALIAIIGVFAGLLAFTLALPIWLLSHDWIGTAVVVYFSGVIITGMLFEAVRETWREMNRK